MRIMSLIAALLVPALLGGTAEKARAGLFVSVSVAPPPLVVYAQPPIPGLGYMWTPGYWAWDEDAAGYYWVPGAWVPAPEPGLLWTPGYWGWSNGIYIWNAGYWGPHVGFYGGIDYGAGYGGEGFEGGYWRGGVFAYNRAVTNVGGAGINIRAYDKAVISRGTSLVSFNGGNRGVRAQPTAQELAFAGERHLPPSADQLKHQRLASKNPALRLANNHGRPPISATSRAADFSKGNVFGARSAVSAFKPAPLKTLGTPPGGGVQRFQSGTFNGGATGANFGAAQSPYRPDRKTIDPPKGVALNGVRRPAPPAPPRPGLHPAIKQPVNHDKKPVEGLGKQAH